MSCKLAIASLSVILVSALGAAAEESPGAGSSLEQQKKAAEAMLSEMLQEAPQTPCGLLTAESVASTFEVDVGNLRQREADGSCWYKLKKRGGQMLEAKISLFQTHETDEAAAQWLARVTTTLSKAEADAKAGAFAAVVGPEGLRYEDLPGVGDEARVSLRDGSVWLRVKNLSFVVAGFLGPKPQPNITGIGDMGAAKNWYREWEKSALGKRKEDSRKLAEVVLAAMAQ